MTLPHDPSALRDREYREAYVEGHVKSYIPYQLRAIREKLRLTQKAFAERIGKPQSVVSRLENTEYGKVTVQTLLDIARRLDIALVVKFASFREFLAAYADLSADAMAVEPYSEKESRAPLPDDYGFARLRDQMFDAVTALWRRRRAEGLTLAALAARIGRDPAWVSRSLAAPGNWTLRTAGELIQALQGEAEIHIAALEDKLETGAVDDAYAGYLVEECRRRPRKN